MSKGESEYLTGGRGLDAGTSFTGGSRDLSSDWLRNVRVCYFVFWIQTYCRMDELEKDENETYFDWKPSQWNPIYHFVWLLDVDFNEIWKEMAERIYRNIESFLGGLAAPGIPKDMFLCFQTPLSNISSVKYKQLPNLLRIIYIWAETCYLHIGPAASILGHLYSNFPNWHRKSGKSLLCS